MSEYTTQAGMDVHARSVSCKALTTETGECRSKTFSGEGHEHELLEWLKKAGKHTNTAKVAVVSELARWMRAIGPQVQREQAAAWGGPRPWPSPPLPKACGA